MIFTDVARGRQIGQDGRRAGSERRKFSITDSEIEELARYALDHRAALRRPMDIEWGKDGVDGKLYILQARPETVKSQREGRYAAALPARSSARTCSRRAAPSARRSAPDPCAWSRPPQRWTACRPATCWSPT